MDVSEAISVRRSVRDFKSERISRGAIEALIAAAIQAPSAMNEQPWIFSVIEDQLLLDRISAAAKAHMLQHEAAGASPSPVRQLLSDPGFHIFYHAPALIVISAKGNGRWAVEDCALAAENMMLAACAAGLGSCWIGFAQTWLGTAEGRAALQLSRDDLPVAPIILGHPKTSAPHVARRPADIRWTGV
jgi:nitroreductase